MFERNDILDVIEPQPSMAELFDEAGQDPGRS
jgi:hypothetical protein